MKLFFAPSGQVDRITFWKAATLLIMIGVIGALLPLISFKLSLAFMVVNIVAFWCWVVLWAKRYRDGGKSGWMALVPVVLFTVLSFILSYFLSSYFGLGGEEKLLFEEKIQDATESNNMSAVWAMSMEFSELEAKKSAVANAIGLGLLGFAFVWLFNDKLIKQETAVDQYDSVS